MANVCTAADVIRICPEFIDVPINTIELYIGLASTQLNADDMGDLAKYAGVLLAAHMMTVANVTGSAGSAGGAAAGAVQSVSVGGVSVSYGNGASSSSTGSFSAGLMLTKYGQEFSRVLRMGGFFMAVL